ncbi:thermonuclease family protein [Alicyclobacillus sp. ALC3]|uniref:thermonuclease family protein n=1 Tax=Alicyclobacillus sp. ALC3 TaxID=2796143 RepID=UPI0023784931|nr:thermonuclease family protein [Alicyclobacillus sp. ALC3]WDL96022.1 thermonuclease family protein [Alicyclobacillus sp. ALC3]
MNKSHLPVSLIGGFGSLLLVVLLALGWQFLNLHSAPTQLRPRSAELFGTPVKVIQVTSGSTVEVKMGNKVTWVDLYGVQAPPTNDPFGAESKALLAALLKQGSVTAVIPRRITAAKGQIPATLYVNGHDVAIVPLESGFVKADTSSPKVEAAYAKLETGVRAAKVGIWSIPSYAKDNFLVKGKSTSH